MKRWKKVILSCGGFALAVAAYLLCTHEAVGPFAPLGRMRAAIPTVKSQPGAVASAGMSVDALPTNQTLTVRGTLPFVLTSERPFNKTLRLAAEALGARTVAVLSRHSLLVEANAEVRARLSSDGRFAKIEEYVPTGKVQPELAKLIREGADSVDVSIVSLSAADRQIVRTCLENGGGEMLKGCINEGDTLRARLPAALVAELAVRGDVRWMERFERPRFMNDLAVNEPQMNVREVWNAHGLTGVGQVISTSDTGIDTGNLETLHEDLRNRVKEIKVVSGCNATDSDGHGTHTAGSIVGDGTKSDGEIRGTAYGANLYAWFCCGTDGYVYTPEEMDELYRNGGDWPASIHSASWGTPVNGKYTAACVEHDRYVWQNPEFLPVFAAGNEGCNDYGTVIYSCSISSPGSAKNVLTVGATQNARSDYDGGWGNGNPKTTAKFSSRGPCQDGRTKPDIAAPGVGIVSTRSAGVDYSYGIKDDYYAYNSGTSMATPLTAGAVALVRQWLVEKKGYADADGTRPTAALIKAVITGGAKDAEKPNNNQGWGRVDLENTLFPSDRAVKLFDRIPFADGEVFEYVVETTNAAPLDVQLCWIDYPGSSSGSQSSARLVNDLDLTVVPLDGDETVHYGNGGSSADTLNNLESVRLSDATPGVYLITVTCKNVTYDYTDGGAAALYVRGAFDPEAESAELERVRIKRDPGTTYTSLDKALAAAQANDEIEILRPASLRQSATLAVNCTITATNENPSASAVNALAGLTVANGARVLFQNVVLTNAASVTVEAGGTAAFSGIAEVGPVATADSSGVELAGELLSSLCVTSPDLSQDAVFGMFTCDYATAGATAYRLYNAADPDLGGVADSATGELRWGVVEVPLEDAFCIVDDGSDRKGYRTFTGALKAAKDLDATITVRRDISHTNAVTLAHDLTLASEDGAVLSLAANATFVVPGGLHLVLTNLVVSGADATLANCAFQVTGGEMTLESGATVRDVTCARKGTGSAVCVTDGSVTMKDGSSILNCAATQSGTMGGAICAKGATGKSPVVELQGEATITGCSAKLAGGGLAVLNNATLRLSGSPRITNNFVGGDEDDAYVYDSVEITGPFTVSAKIGLELDGAEEGATIATYDPTVLTEAEPKVAAKAFFNTSDVTGTGGEALSAAVGEGDEQTGTLVWAVVPTTIETDEEHGVVRLVYPGAEPLYYLSLDDALTSVTNDCRVELMKELTHLADAYAIGYNVTLTTAPTLGKTAMLDRSSGSITVPSGASLTITNLVVSGRYRKDLSSEIEDKVKSRLFFVDGGELTFEAGAGVRGFAGEGSRGASAVTVYNDGAFTMKEGAFIEDCENTYEDTLKDVNSGMGVGLLVDGATATLLGGHVTGCSVKYGAVSICNRSTVYVSGAFSATNNFNLASAASDVMVEDQSYLVLAASLADEAKIGRVTGYLSDTNLVATVPNWTNVWATTLPADDAVKFVRNEADGVYGVPVTNETDTALIVWSSSLQTDEETQASYYEDEEGNRYGVVTDPAPVPPSPEPEPETVTTNYPTAIAFKSIVREADTATLVITDAVQWCNYRVFATNSLEGGFVVTNAVGDFIIEPATNFQWKTTDKEIELTFPATDAQRFWKALGTWGIVPME